MDLPEVPGSGLRAVRSGPGGMAEQAVLVADLGPAGLVAPAGTLEGPSGEQLAGGSHVGEKVP